MNDGYLDPTRPQVPAPTKFRTIDENGRVVTSHPPMGTTFLTEPHYYFNSEKSASMHRPDGKKLAFVFGVLATNIKQDVDYLEGEIAEAHPHIRHATDQEVDAYNMRIDPRGTVRKSVRAEVEEEVREALEKKIRAEMEQKYKLRADVPEERAAAANAAAGQAAVDAGNASAAKLSGVDAIRARAAAIAGGIQVPGATIIPVMESRPAPLQGIVGTDAIKDGAAGSGV